MAFGFGSSAPAASSGGFSFGGSSAPAFGAPSSTPAFGAAASTGFSFAAPSSTPAFGATPSSTPAFGAAPASSTPAFGFSASSTPAFGAATSSPSVFGASSTPAFNFSSTPAFGTPSSSPSVFGASSTPAFGQTAAPQPSLFGQAAAQQPQQQAQQVPFTRASTFESLPQDVQKQLQQIQEQISRYDADRLKVQQLPHLQEAPAQQQGLEAEIASVRGELKELLGLISTQAEGLLDFKDKSLQLVKATDIIVRVYKRNKEWREAMNRGEQVNMQQYLTLPVLLPGPYLEQAVRGMAETVAEYSRVLDEVEQVLASSSLQDPSQVDWRTVLPTIVSNMHDYFISVAAKLEKTHSEVERLKALYNARNRERGIFTDPFERSRRSEQLPQPQQHRLPAAPLLPGLPAAPALMPAAGGLFGGGQVPATPVPAATPAQGAGSFGSPFPAATPFGASPFGGPPNSGLSRSASKPKSKKR